MPKYGIVNTTRLNLRNAANSSATVLTQLPKGTLVEILKTVDGEWAQVKVESTATTGFVATDFLHLSDTHPDAPLKDPTAKIEIISGPVRVRSGPGTQFSILGSVNQGTILDLLSADGEWFKVFFSGVEAYIAAQFARRVSPNTRPLNGYLVDQPDLMELELVPERIIPAQVPSTRQNAAARVWNSYGNLLSELATMLNINVASMVAVIAAESSGRAFADDGRMIIRFENHIFWNYWGKDNADFFDRFFQFDRSAPANAWKNHKFRPHPGADFASFHGSQEKEWTVLKFARSLDDSAALFSISMGAPQIMGFNYKRLGYESVQEMFETFARSAHAQILAMFDFVKGPGTSSQAIQALQNGDYLTFASIYNGPGNAQTYRAIIQDYVGIFNDLLPTAVFTPRDTHSHHDLPDVPEPEAEAEPPKPEKPAEIPIKLIASVDNLRVRSAPNTGSEVLEHLRKGEVTTALESTVEVNRKLAASSDAGEFLQIRTDENRVGYVAAWLMAPAPDTQPAPVETPTSETPSTPTTPTDTTPPVTQPEPQPPVIVAPPVDLPAQSATATAAVDGLRVRSAPNTNASVVENLRLNEPVTLLEAEDIARTKMKQPESAAQFLHVRTDEGREGYVAAWLMSPSTTTQTKAAVNEFIANIPEKVLPEGYHALWAMQEKFGLPDPFDVLPVELRTQNEVTNMQVNGFGPNTFASRNWQRWYKRVGGMHNGLDLVVKTGIPLLAVADGVIVKNWVFLADPAEKTLVLWCFLPERFRDSRGRRMMSNVLVAYGHMSNNTMRKNREVVRAGDVIGLGGTPVGSANNDHLHLEVHWLVGDTNLPNPRAPRRLLADYKRAQPLDNNTPWNPQLFFTPRVNKYFRHQGETVGYLRTLPDYPTRAMLKAVGANHLPDVNQFTLAYYRYGITPVWTAPKGGGVWQNGVVTTDMLPERMKTFPTFEPYEADFL